MLKASLLGILVVISQSGLAQLVPEGFAVPEGLRHEAFVLEPLTQRHARLDYEAVMASKLKLRTLFGDEWPPDDFSLADNRRDIELHMAQFARREAFTYSVLSVDRKRAVGCVYIVPSEDSQADVAVVLWVRRGDESLEPKLRLAIAEWLKDEWPFQRVTGLD